MTFGLIFLDDDGATWTVGPLPGEAPGATTGLRFCRPSFLEPVEEVHVRPLPDGWPSCSVDEFRRALARARTTPPPS